MDRYRFHPLRNILRSCLCQAVLLAAFPVIAQSGPEPAYYAPIRVGNMVTVIPVFGDQDGDGLNDNLDCWPSNASLPVNPVPWLDYDGDCYSDSEDPDDDNDGMDDAWELTYGFDPFSPNAYEDADSDLIPNYRERQDSTSPIDANAFTLRPADDFDMDDMQDIYEVSMGLDRFTNDAGLDPDSDGLTNLQEFQADTDPFDADTDDDGYDDLVDLYPNDPFEWEDKNNNGIPDNSEPWEHGGAWITLIDASSGVNVLQNDLITFMQDEKLVVEWEGQNITSCQIGLFSVADDDITFDVDPAELGGRIEFPAFHFDVGEWLLSLTCYGLFNSLDGEIIALDVVGNAQNPKLPAPVISVVPSSTSFPQNQSIQINWNASNAEACYIDGFGYEFDPNGPSTIPANSLEVGTHNLGFWCVGEQDVSETQVLSLTVNPPQSGQAARGPGGRVVKAEAVTSGSGGGLSGQAVVGPGASGEYLAYTGNNNTDSRVDVLVVPAAGNNDSGVAPFALISNGSDNGWTVRAGSEWFSGGSITSGNWVLDAGVQLIKGDYDADGLDDILIKNITNEEDVMTFAHNIANSVPKDIRVVDDNFRQFFEELYEQILDPNWAVNNTLILTETTYVTVNQNPMYCFSNTCESSSIYFPVSVGGINVGISTPIPGVIDAMGQFSVQVLKKVVLESGHFDLSQPVHSMTPIVNWVLNDILDGGGLLSGSVEAKTLSWSISAVLGRPYMGGALNLTAGGITLPGEINIPIEGIKVSRILRFFGWLGFIISAAIVAEEIADDYILYHYTDLGGKNGIKGSGTIIPSSYTGAAHLTDDVYFTSSSAKSKLALDKFPIGFFLVLKSKNPLVFHAGEVDPANGELGGGSEWLSPGGANAKWGDEINFRTVWINIINI